MMRETEADDDDVFGVFNLTSPIAWKSEAGADVGERADWMTGGGRRQGMKGR